MRRPLATEYAAHYGNYVSLVPEHDVIEALARQIGETTNFLRSVPASEAEVLHPPYTWTIKQVLGHMIDGERIFAYRALRFARADRTPLPGFDEKHVRRHRRVEPHRPDGPGR